MTVAAAGTPRAFQLYGLLAETFIHAGIGQAQGAIDLPVARESTTRYPYIAGSSVKGAARDAFRRHWWVDERRDDKPFRAATRAEIIVFGPDTSGAAEGAGELIFSDMRLLFLPVRSLTGACRYVTCPELIYRFLADLARAGVIDSCVGELAAAAPKLLPAVRNEAISKSHTGGLYLEELCFTGVKSDEVPKLAACAALLLPPTSGMAAALADRLTVVSDDAFAWFAENALPVRMRNALDEKKRVKNGALWSEEYLAPDTLMYMLAGTRGSATAPVKLPVDGNANGECQVGVAFSELLKQERNYFQVGGNETVGHGWFQVRQFGANGAGGGK
jgi:CRISPR-associated protein Cmr4